MRQTFLLALTLAVALPLGVSAQSPAPTTPAPATALPASPTPASPAPARPGSTSAAPRSPPASQAQPAAPRPSGPGTVTQQGGPLGAPASRQPRSFAFCNREAMTRKYRGAERRHFVSRCQLGYGRRLFRRRGTPPTPPA